MAIKRNSWLIRSNTSCRVPAELEAVGVLMEPLSIVEKAIDEALRLQLVRCPEAAITPDWIVGRRCLVAGLGPVGLLACMVLRLRGADVYGLDVVDSSERPPEVADVIGGHYVDGRKVPADQVEKKIGPMDVILDASGIAALEFNLLDALARNGVYVITGIPGGDHPLQIAGCGIGPPVGPGQSGHAGQRQRCARPFSNGRG